MHRVEEEGEAEDVDVMERTRQYKPAICCAHNSRGDTRSFNSGN